MKHRIRFQYRPSGDARPEDYEQPFNLATEDGPVLLPEIGDHVDVQVDPEHELQITGIVENRTFTYITMQQETWCLITIVVTNSPVDWGRLMKD
jgi:hypothetical protein